MTGRRQLVVAGALLLVAGDAPAQSGLWPEWLGSYAGTLHFYRSIPLEDIYPPPKHPHVDQEDPTPFAVISPSASRTAAQWSGCASTAGRCKPPRGARPCTSAG